ncbi:hypothetical protein DENSPDRAFT_493288 [Dentipellis sp. KUC8613]|nr:hypothetical protein DENSPDRAFT_493288 [Dentipellis sp. KUC8613]
MSLISSPLNSTRLSRSKFTRLDAAPPTLLHGQFTSRASCGLHTTSQVYSSVTAPPRPLLAEQNPSTLRSPQARYQHRLEHDRRVHPLLPQTPTKTRSTEHRAPIHSDDLHSQHQHPTPYGAKAMVPAPTAVDTISPQAAP